MLRRNSYPPYRQLQALSRMVDEWLDRSYSLDLTAGGLDLFPTSPGWSQAAFPGDNLAVDMYEMDDAYVVEAALPGLKPEEIEVETRSGFLTIKSIKGHEHERSGAGWRMKERSFQAWQRTLRLPESVYVDRAHAELKDGILTVSLPKLDSSKKRVNRIKVNLPRLKVPRLRKGGKGIHISKN